MQARFFEELKTRTEQLIKDVDDFSTNLFDDTEDSSDGQGSVINTKLVYQFRLNCQSALYVITQMDKYFMYILGIEPHHSPSKNLERMSHALGNNDLSQMLTLLSLLVESLLKVAHRLEQNKHIVETKYITLRPVFTKLQQLENSQEPALQLLKQKLSELQLLKTPIGPIYDHIQALRGPISQFHKALEHGIAESLQLEQELGLKAAPSPTPSLKPYNPFDPYR